MSTFVIPLDGLCATTDVDALDGDDAAAFAIAYPSSARRS